MIVAGSASPLLLSSAGGYNLTNSLRFRSSASAYLNRTPASAGDRQKWTWSGWVKLGLLNPSSGWNCIFGAYSNDSNRTFFYTNNNSVSNTFYIFDVNGGSTASNLISTQVLRDTSAWYHLVVAVDTTQSTSSNRIKVYLNGSQITSFGTASYPSQNANLMVNNNVVHYIGASSYSGINLFHDGYMTEINFIDGQALTPSSFGETSATTGVWIPKKYSGTYGTNGFYLPFTDNSALTTSSNVGLGKDFSGNSNYWTTNNISITSGSTYDSMTDVPTLTSTTAANYCVVNPLPPSTSGGSWYTQDGNLKLVRNGGGFITAVATMGVTSGKWYWEVIPQNSGNQFTIGIAKDGYDWTTYLGSNAFGWSYEGGSGVKYTNGSSSAYGATYTTNDVIGVAFDADAGTLTFYKNNTSQGQAFSGLTSGPYYPASGVSNLNTAAVFNFGQRPFAYTPPTGFNRLNTFNLPTPTIGATASTTANKYFDALLYTGNGSASQRTDISWANMQPDMVWIKNRTSANNHVLHDDVRGTNAALQPNLTNATDSPVGFGADGFGFDGVANQLRIFTADGRYNTNGNAYVTWGWKASGVAGVTNTAGSITSTVSANTTAGFSIVTYTGNGTGGATIGHGLGVAPSMIILKRRNGTSNWTVGHSSLPSWAYYLVLNLSDAQGNNNVVWNSTAPTSSVFTVGTGADQNGSGNTIVGYCFAQVAGYSAIGSYTGNGSSDGPFIFTGFRPRYLMIKRSDSTADWNVRDTARSPYNVVGEALYPNLSFAEYSGSETYLDILSNGFKLRGNWNSSNASGGTYIYMAFCESPFKFSNAR